MTCNDHGSPWTAADHLKWWLLGLGLALEAAATVGAILFSIYLLHAILGVDLLGVRP